MSSRLRVCVLSAALACMCTNVLMAVVAPPADGLTTAAQFVPSEKAPKVTRVDLLGAVDPVTESEFTNSLGKTGSEFLGTANQGIGFTLPAEGERGTDLTCSLDETVMTAGLVACGPTADNHLARCFAAVAGMDTVTVRFGVEAINETLTVTVSLYEDTNGCPPTIANLVLLGSTTVILTSADNMTLVTVPLAVPVAAGTNLVVDVFYTTVSGIGSWLGGNNLGQTCPTYILSNACGLGEYTDVAAIGFPDAMFIVTVTGGAGADCGDGICDPGEDCANCPADCGACVCGDGTCDPNEDCASCEQDCGVCGKMMTVEIFTDNYPGETTWQIVHKATGTIVAAEGPLSDPLTLHTWNVPLTLEPNCYNFTIFDAYGDGLCCAYGIGWYKVYKDGVLVGEGGEFASEETISNIGEDCVDPFCGDGMCNGDETCSSCEEDCGLCACPCPPGATPEGEPVCGDGYVDAYNGGCNSTPAVFQQVSCGDEICGQTGVFDGGAMKDTDWFEFYHGGGDITWSITGDFETLIFIIDPGPGDCTNYVLYSSTGLPCELNSVTVTLGAGTYWVWAGPLNWNPLPCGTEYTATLTCTGSVCGDTVCDGDEDCNSCPDDCGVCGCGTPGTGECCAVGGTGSPYCEDLVCCETVCGYDAFCCDIEWDSQCAGEAAGEVVCDCNPYCGDGLCNGDEDCFTCPGDCGVCVCGDGTCDPGEDCVNCEVDCGVCPLMLTCSFDKDIAPGLMVACQPLANNHIARCFPDVPGLTSVSVRFGFEALSEDLLVTISLYEDTNGCPPTVANLVLLGQTTYTYTQGEAMTIVTVPLSVPVAAGTDLVVDIDYTTFVAGAWMGASAAGETCDTYLLSADCGLTDYVSTGSIGFPDAAVILFVDYTGGADCGDGTCEPGEDCANCPADCGACVCGNGTCDPGEDCNNCEADCGVCPFCGDGTCDSGEDCNNCEADCGACVLCDNCYTNCGVVRPVCDNAGSPDDWITNVTFAGINHDSDNEPCPCSYADYTSQMAFVTAGSTNDLTVTFCSEGIWTQHVRAWIDWNGDLDLTCDESIYLGSGVDATLTAPVTVPNGTPEGCYLMRIIEEYSTDPGCDASCAGGMYGETEDYTVCVGPPPVCGNGTCDPGEDCDSCPQDCVCPFCGDGMCNGDEDCMTCEEDCGPCPACTDFEVMAPGVFTGNTCGAGNDCGLRPTEDHTYAVTLPNAGTWTFSLCGSTYDTYLGVDDSGCCGGNIGAIDDSECDGVFGLQSELTFDLPAGVVGVSVEGFSGCGSYTLTISKAGPNCPGSIISAIPVDGTLDARQHHSATGDPLDRDGIGASDDPEGLIVIDVGEVGVDVACWSMCESIGDVALPANGFGSIVDGGDGTYTITLDRGITPRATTRISYAGGGTVSYGKLPGDVTAQGVMDILDVAEIIQIFNGAPSVWGDYSADIDYFGDLGILDIPAVINLFNGSGTYAGDGYGAWNGKTLDTSACP